VDLFINAFMQLGW